MNGAQVTPCVHSQLGPDVREGEEEQTMKAASFARNIWKQRSDRQGSQPCLLPLNTMLCLSEMYGEVLFIVTVLLYHKFQ